MLSAWGGPALAFSGASPGYMLTISRRTSPALNAPPSWTFHLAKPPSVIVGLIAGMVNLEKAWAAAEAWSAVGTWEQKTSGRAGHETFRQRGRLRN